MNRKYHKIIGAIIALCGYVSPAIAVPDGPAAIYPLQQADSANPEFSWQDQPDSKLYRLYVYDRFQRQRVHLQNHRQSDICDAGVCSVNLGLNLGLSKNHRWFVRAWDNDGWGAWTRTYFDYVDELPAKVTTTNPTGPLTTATPEFIWSDLGNATDYRLYVRDVSSSTTVLLKTYAANEVCSNNVCSVTPVNFELPESDNLLFRVRARNSGGWGSYSTPRRFSYTEPNETPLAFNDTAIVDAGDSVSIEVLSNDSDPDGELDTDTVTITQSPMSGSLTVQADGTVLYTQDGGAATSDSFYYVVSDDDGAVSLPALVSIEIADQSDELLINAAFYDQLNAWSVCDTTTASVVNNAVVLSDRNCVDQSIDSVAGQELELTCEVRRLTQGSEWTGIGLSFYDENWEFISEPDAVPVVSDSYRNYTVTGTTPTGTRYVLAWTYTVAGASVNRCSLINSGSVEPPPPPPPSGVDFCPAYLDSTLYRPRANTLVISSTDNNWEEQIESAPPNTEILLSDGIYYFDKETIVMSNPDVTVRSLSGNPDAVVIEGTGFYTGQSEGFMISADRITIAELTMHGMRRHAVAMKPELDSDGALQDTYVYNMDIYDTGTQHVKGSDGGKNNDAVIACNTIGYTPGAAVGDYNGAIGIFEGVDVVVRDNYIYNLTGDGSGCNVAEPETPCIYESAPAIYMRSSQDSIVERNQIIESFRGISLGLHNGNVRGVVRNNFIYRTGPGDMGISVELSSDTIVEHNTVMVQGYWAPIEVKSGTGGHVFRNNLTNLPIQLRGTTGTTLEGNIESATDNDFATAGEPHLRSSSTAIGAGVVPTETTADIDGDARSGQWDVGADQYTE